MVNDMHNSTFVSTATVECNGRITFVLGREKKRILWALIFVYTPFAYSLLPPHAAIASRTKNNLKSIFSVRFLNRKPKNYERYQTSKT